MRALYRVSCTACPFTCDTNSHIEAQKIRRFHDNWNSDERGPSGVRLHQVIITASRFAMPAHHVQAHIEDAAGVAA